MLGFLRGRSILTRDLFDSRKEIAARKRANNNAIPKTPRLQLNTQAWLSNAPWKLEVVPYVSVDVFSQVFLDVGSRLDLQF